MDLGGNPTTTLATTTPDVPRGIIEFNRGDCNVTLWGD